jgi:uroporphyrinogen decarboxylase
MPKPKVKNKLSVKPDPDFVRLEMVLKRQGVPARLPFYELFSDIEIDVLEHLNFDCSSVKRATVKWIDRFKCHVKYMYQLGYDYVNIGRNWDFPKMQNPAAETTKGTRSYVTTQVHVISNTEDFENYNWPDIESLDYSRFNEAEKIIPAGMKVIALCSGILENVTLLLGNENICYLLFDDPELVRKTFKAVADCIIKYYDIVASYDIVAALSLSDDMGFKTQTMLSPAVYRDYLFPLHKKLVDVIHSHNKIAILHSCGNLEAVMDDIIECGWDAKHSFEDNILSVWQAKQKFGDRIALLGGFDMDKICKMSTNEVREHTRMLIENCFAEGGWALGTGNSVADYVPLENFLTMLDEGFVYNLNNT